MLAGIWLVPGNWPPIPTMNNYALIADLIKDRVTMHDAIALYAPEPEPRYNRIPCPIHEGKSYNLGFNDKLFHCFVCGSGGDVIHFAQHIFGIPFPAALAKLNADFQCGVILDRKPTIREQRSAQNRHREILAKRAAEEAKRKAYDDLYDELWGEWVRLDRNRMDYAPKTPEDELHPLFVEAVHKIDYQLYLIDNLL